jgi:hypothetical protein
MFQERVPVRFLRGTMRCDEIHFESRAHGAPHGPLFLRGFQWSAQGEQRGLPIFVLVGSNRDFLSLIEPFISSFHLSLTLHQADRFF